MFAQNARRLPTVNGVLERHVEATGGREALLRHKSMTVHGRYEDPAHKADYETAFFTKDGKTLLKVELGGGKEYQTGYDGETAWVLHPDGKVDIAAYVADHALSIEGPIREIYLVDGHTTADSSQWRTQIGWPIFRTAE